MNTRYRYSTWSLASRRQGLLEWNLEKSQYLSLYLDDQPFDALFEPYKDGLYPSIRTLQSPLHSHGEIYDQVFPDGRYLRVPKCTQATLTTFDYFSNPCPLLTGDDTFQTFTHGQPGVDYIEFYFADTSGLIMPWVIANESRLHNWYTSYLICADCADQRDVVVDADPLDSQFSIWYLLVDIIDLKRMLSGLFSSTTYKWVRSRNAILGDPRYKRSTARWIADSELAFIFGWLPTFRDMEDFVLALRKFRDRYKLISEITKVPHKYRYKPISVSTSDRLRNFTLHGQETFTGYLGTLSSPVTCEVTWDSTGKDMVPRPGRVYPFQYRDTLWYQWSSPEYSGWASRLKQFIDDFGVLDPAALWDVIPFSFVVDWFLRIGDWLHNHKPKVCPLDIVVRDYCETVRLETSLSFRANVTYPLAINDKNAVFTGWKKTALAHHTSFFRDRRVPNVRKGSYSLQPGSGFSLRRVGIAAALTAQRVPKIVNFLTK